MAQVTGRVVEIGHADPRRTIYDLITEGNAGGGKKIRNLAYFSPLNPGATIGNHYHERMWETYLILSGQGLFTSVGVVTEKKQEIMIWNTPFRIVIPPRYAHTLRASTQMTLLIAATGEQSDVVPYPCG